MSSELQILAQMSEAGLAQMPPTPLDKSGKFKRFGKGSKGWYVLREIELDGGKTVLTGAFGWFQGENRNTVPVKVDAEEMSDEDRQAYRRKLREAEAAEEKKRQEAARLAANRARDQWSKAAGVPVEHPYLVRKQVPAEGLRVSRDGKLLIPLMRDGQLLGLQKIDPAGEKLLNKGMDAIGVMHVLGQLEGAPVIALGEGYATCATARLAPAPGYDLPVVVALNAGNILHVARWLRKHYPNAHLLLLADDDYLLTERFAVFLQEDFKVSVQVPIDGATHRVVADDGQAVDVMARWRSDAQGVRFISTDVRRGRTISTPTFSNAGVASCSAAAKEVGNASVAVPLFAVDRAGRKLTDYNDLQIEEGLDKVTAQIEAAILAALQGTWASSATAAEVAPQPVATPSLAAEQRNTRPYASPARAAGTMMQPAPPLSLAAQQRNTSSPAPSAQAAGPVLQPAPHLSLATEQGEAVLPSTPSAQAAAGLAVPPSPLAAEQPGGSPTEELPEDFDVRFGADTGPQGAAGEQAEVVSTPAPRLALVRGGGGEPTGDEDDDPKKDKQEKPKKVYGQEHWDKVNDVLDNFILIYGEDMVWDCRHRMLMRISAMRTIVANSDVMKFWSGDARKWVLKKNIVFDPTETPSPAVSGPIATVNLFAGWPMRPKKGKCIQILTLLSHLCDGNEDMETWIARWLAYPLRNPGAKMETSIIMHGDEGSGKNFFFERVVKPIYGQYGYVIGNDQLESKFNDWASMKLFMVADEVVTRAELKQMKGKLKGLVAGETVIVNPKGMPEHVEKNQMNFVFLSNELQPLALDKTDRRYLVVWTPPALTKEFYESVGEEIRQGGIEAFYHYLMHELDMGDFNRHTKPIYNEAKDRLIEKSLAPAERFYREWSRGFLPLPFITVSVNQLYDAFKVWCGRSGEPMYTSMTTFSPQVERYAGGALKKHLIKYELASEVKQRMVFLVGEQPPGRSLADWAEGSSALFEKNYQTYRNRGAPHVEG